MHRNDVIFFESIAAFAIFSAFHNEEISTLIKQHASFLTPFISTGVFILLYKTFAFLYRKKFWTYMHPSTDISGQWVYWLKNNKSSTEIYGIFTINQDLHYIDIKNGDCWNKKYSNPTDDNKRGTWISLASTASNDNLYIIFRLTPIQNEGDDNSPYDGSIVLNITRDGNRATKMSGRYNDLDGRTGNNGPIVAEKVPKSSREKHIEAALKRFGHN